MNINILQWRYSTFLIIFLLWLWLPIESAQAFPLSSVDCTASMRTNPINIGSTITPDNAGRASIDATLEYSCKNRGFFSGYVSVCLAAKGGDNSTVTNPRYLTNSTDETSTLPFNMTLPGGSIWGTRTNSGSEYQGSQLYLPGLVFGSPTKSDSVTITVSLLSSEKNTFPTSGTYTNFFGGGSATLIYDTDNSDSNCATAIQGTKPFTFTVQATVIDSCKITASPGIIDLGSYSASETNTIKGNGAIGVTCTNTTPYNIGLAPSNGSTTGAGVMRGTASNTDKVPYQLRSSTGLSGAVWGNTATSTSVGNGVNGTGSGGVQNKTVYVTVPSADFKPDNYSDTVTINVNY
ncbi:spore coat U domain-containing protein [Psychrobacter sp.]|uniref:Csu type fimbrial protein n=1 Tax=Psychrobacter sp. TaxID=56811 RepID=UPI003BAE9006